MTNSAMQSSIYRGLNSAISAAKRPRCVERSSPAFICANCKASPTRSPFAVTSNNKRFSTTTPVKLQDESSQYPQNHYDFFPQTFPQGPPPKASFSPDLKQLRKEFLQLQAKAHPDLAPQHQKRRAEALSMRINEAYKTLQSPLRRAQYLLSQQGIDVEDESAKLDDPSLLMEVMEAREAVEEVEDEEQLEGIRAENNERIEASVRRLENAFRDNELENAAKEAIKLRYWANIEESISGWEKGRGGGVLHH